MPAFARVLVLSLALAPTPAVADAAPSATEFVRSLYAHYLGKDARGVPFERAADVARWCAPPLTKLILADRARAARRDDVPTLDGDPFVHAQDWMLSDLHIDVTERGDRATAKVSFLNAGEHVALTLALVRGPAGWRVADVDAGDGSLVALLRKAR
jgi:hypothetical protein